MAPGVRGRKKAQLLHQELSSTRERVLLTGATGFVGKAILEELLRRGYHVVAVARNAAAHPAEPGVIRVSANVLQTGWERWAEGCSAAIHLVGILREQPKRGITFQALHRKATERVVQACQKLKIPRLIHMSAAGAHPQGSTPYQRSKWEAEEVVRHSPLQWTIFRPSVIFGPGDGFTTLLTQNLRKFPLFPVFGDGEYRLQPVAVEEVAEAFVLALSKPESVGCVVELGGPEALSFNQVLRRTLRALGLRRPILHLPLSFGRLAVRCLQLLPNPPATPDELAMLVAGNTVDNTLAKKLFGLPLRPFEGPTWMLED